MSKMDEPADPPTGTIYEEPWWLDAVAPGAWGAAIVEKGDRIDARLPYVIKRRYGLKVLGLPPLTQHMGPWLRITGDKVAKRRSQEANLLEGLIDALPAADVVDLNLGPAVTNWLPFHWAGYEQTTRYTYRLEDLADLEAVWSGLKASGRRHIRKAEKLVEVKTDRSLEAFLAVQDKTFERQGERFPYDKDLVRRLDAACAGRDRRRVFLAEDAQGRHHAGAYTVWDDHSAYMIMSGNDPALRDSSAMPLVVWKAIEHAASIGRSFDFEGSMLPHVEPFFRSFGGDLTPYFQVRRYGRRARMLRGLGMMMGKDV